MSPTKGCQSFQCKSVKERARLRLHCSWEKFILDWGTLSLLLVKLSELGVVLVAENPVCPLSQVSTGPACSGTFFNCDYAFYVQFFVFVFILMVEMSTISSCHPLCGVYKARLKRQVLSLFSRFQHFSDLVQKLKACLPNLEQLKD